MGEKRDSGSKDADNFGAEFGYLLFLYNLIQKITLKYAMKKPIS